MTGMRFQFGLIIVALCALSCRQSDSPDNTDIPTFDADQAQLFSDAQVAYRGRNYTSALELLDSFRQAVGHDVADADFLRGRIYFDVQQYDNAAQSYDNVVKLERDYPGVWHNLGNVYFQKRQYRRAQQSFEQENEYNPAALPWHGLGGVFEALGIADSAKWAYEQAIQIDSTYVPARASLADWYEREGLPAEALAAAESALSIDSKNHELMYKVGRLKQTLGASDEAARLLTTVVEKEPWNYGAMFQLAQAFQALGEKEDANNLLNRANQVRAEQAEIDLLANSARSQPESFEKQVAYANALRNSRRLNDAVSVYLIAASLRPGNLSLQNNIATLQLELGYSDQALSRYTQIIAVDSTFGEAWINLVGYYSRQGDDEKARQAWEKAVRYAPDHPVVQRALSANRN